MREYQELYNSDFQLSAEGMELTSIKYKRLILVQETLPQSSVKSPDAVSPSADSASLPSRVGSPPAPSQIRKYSTRTLKPGSEVQTVTKSSTGVVHTRTVYPDGIIKTETKRPDGIVVPLQRMDPKVLLLREENGSYKFTGIDSITLSDVRSLQDILTAVKEKQRHIDLINTKGYVNSTRLSSYPILKGYLKTYINEKEPGANVQRVDVTLESLDNRLTLNEKRVLVG